MADGGAPARSAEIYGYVRGRWGLLDTVADAPRDEVIHRGRAHLSRPEVVAVRILVGRAGDSVRGKPFVAYRAQKFNVPELDLPAFRPGSARMDGVPDDPPPIPPFLVPAQPPGGRPSGRRAARYVLAGTATLCLGFLAARHAIPGGADPYGLVPSATAVAVLIAAGLLLTRDLTRLEPTATSSPEDREAPAPEPAGQAAPPPVLRLLSDALARIDGEMPESVSGETTRLGIRLYAAGAADGQAARAGGAAGRDPVADCLLLLGEQEGEAARFAAALDDLLLGPEAQELYRAGRKDLAAYADGDGLGGGPGGTGLGHALARWIEAAAAGERGGGGNLAVLAVAPLPPTHTPVVEAVAGAFGGRGFSRDGTAVTAGFASVESALDAACAIRDAIRAGPTPSDAGCGLTIAARPRPGGPYPAPAASAALALARAAPGEVATTPVLRAVLTARGAALGYVPLPGAEGFVVSALGM